MKTRNLLAVFVGSIVAYSASATVVFSDDFNEVDGTLLNGKAPDVGSGNWNVSAGEGDFDIQGGSLDTSGAARVAFGTFTAALGSGEVLTLSFDTLATGGGSPLSGGYAGVSLYTGGDEDIFVGDTFGTDFWGIAGPQTGGDQDSSDSTPATTATFSYNFDTGAWTFTNTAGANLAGTGTAGRSFDNIRIANGNGGDLHVDNLSVDISDVPEPGSLALLGLGGLALLRRRRA